MASPPTIPTTERDMRDLNRAWLKAQSRDEFYRTMYPRPEAGETPYGPASILSDDEVRKVTLAYYLRDRYGIHGPARFADHYVRFVVSRDGIGREQATRTQMDAPPERKPWYRSLWPFGRD